MIQTKIREEALLQEIISYGNLNTNVIIPSSFEGMLRKKISTLEKITDDDKEFLFMDINFLKEIIAQTKYTEVLTGDSLGGLLREKLIIQNIIMPKIYPLHIMQEVNILNALIDCADQETNIVNVSNLKLLLSI